MKRSFVSNPAAVRVPKVSTSLQHESLYGAWSTHGIIYKLALKDNPAWAALKRQSICGGIATPSVRIPLIAQALNTTEQDILRLRGADISARDADGLLFFKGLRYCRACLDFGYHSILYQHVGLARCPLHLTPFDDSCPQCHRVIIPTFDSALEHPYECSTCLGNLSKTMHRLQDMESARWADQMAGARRPVLVASHKPPGFSRLFSDLPNFMSSPSSPGASKLYQRATVWAEPHDPLWTNFIEEELHITPRPTHDGASETDTTVPALAAERVLIWLHKVCDSHAQVAMRLANRLGRCPRGLRINAHASVIGTAFYKLAYAFDLVQESQTVFEAQLRNLNGQLSACNGKKMIRYGDEAPRLPELDYRLMQLEMMGMLAKLLVKHKSQSSLCDVSWLELPHPIEFAPTWSIRYGAEGFATVRIRARANEKRLVRLIRRRWLDQLVYVSKDPIGQDAFWRDNRLDTVWHEKASIDRKSKVVLEPVHDLSHPRQLRHEEEAPK